jgi:hypothetical protein
MKDMDVYESVRRYMVIEGGSRRGSLGLIARPLTSAWRFRRRLAIG